MTMLQTLRLQRDAMIEQMKSVTLSVPQLLVFQELTFRIEVIESCQALSVNAPESTDIKALSAHFRFVDAFIHYIAQDRRLALPAKDAGEQKTIELNRKAAEDNLNRVIADYLRQFGSFVPDTPQKYGETIGRVIQTVLIAWIQHRNSYIEIPKYKEASK